MDTANPAQGMKAITIKEIELRTQAQRSAPVARQHYVKFFVGKMLRSTKVAHESKNCTSWDNVRFYFDGDDRSVLLVQVYQKHRPEKEELVGRLSETIREISGKLENGVFESTLGKDNPYGSDLSGIAIKFRFTTEPRGSTNADERQAMDAITRAAKEVDGLGSLQGVIDTLNSPEIGLFSKIGASLPPIFPYTLLAQSVISVLTQALTDQKNRDERIVRLAGMISDVFMFVENVEAHTKTSTLLIQQVTECGYFIAEYAKQKDPWIRIVKYKISDINARITGYENKLRELKTAFLNGVSGQTGTKPLAKL